MPALAETHGVAMPTPPVYSVETRPVEGSVPLTHYLWILKRNRWRILAFVLSSVLATWIVSARLTPLYEATATVDIDRQSPTGIIGQEAVRSITNDADQFLATQAKLIQSDSVLRSVVEKYRLWEIPGELESVSPESPYSQEAPVVLKRLKVTRPPNTYLLLISYRNRDPQLAADVANAIARSYLEHTYNIRYKAAANLSSFMEKQLEELKAKMERSSAALAQFERELNVINPEERTSILTARLLQLNSEFTNAQADRVRKETIYQTVKAGSLDAAVVSSQGESLRNLMERLNQAQERFAEVRSHYGANHPEYRRAQAQLNELKSQVEKTVESIRQRVEIEYRQALQREAMLQKAVQETKAEIDALNARSFQYQALKREAEADKALYEELVRKIKEAGINASFQNSSIRIADPARPPVKPVFPKVKLNIVLAFVISTLLAIGLAILGDALDDTVRDPEQVTRMVRAEVIGSLPLVKDWKGRLAPTALTSGSRALVPAGSNGQHHAVTGFEEAIRTVRNSILLADFDRNLHSLLITSASPGEGKSTVAAHLAAAHAQQGYRTLLIDGDLRRPSLHRRFEVPGVIGLSNVLLSEIPWQSVVVKAPGVPNLSILPAGPVSRRAADQLGRTLSLVLEEAASEYDLVIVDAPPLLGFAEPLQMATLVDGVVVVARAGETSRKAVASVIATLRRVRASIVGVVLNEVHKETSDRYYYYYSHYGKYYRDAEGFDGDRPRA